ncbi:MAG TPA: SdpI family protein [Anaerohalosphaeraceae bacterium]|nr:SdpI family protein [Anaerohalosphaeraceae bacterium]HOL89290.1 SdpI family protein [Anaerohalosphaeraceae bacterium]HPP56874.1 SdpI family protein [Anaerohalosphaeraceae bacterium]
MKMRITTVLIWLTVAAAFGISGIFYPKMPVIMASHWNAAGQVDGYMPKSVLMFLLPGIMAAEALFFYAILLIDPLRKNIFKFRVYYEGFILLITIFLLAVHLFTIAWSLRIQISMNVFMPLMIGILFFVMGSILPHLKPNWFLGIRTPWTLSNETVWNRTHRIGGILFKTAAIFVLFGALRPQYAVGMVLTPVLAASLLTILYSLVLYLRLK